MTKTVIFDFDGTIADTFESSIEIINSLSDKYGYKKFENEEIEKLRSRSMQDNLKELHISLFKLPLVLKDFTSRAKETITSQNPVNKMPSLLKDLHHNGYNLNIITSNSVENVSIFLDKHNLNYFNHIYSDQSLFGKHIVIANFLKKYQIKHEDAIYIGDEIRDIAAARKVKIKIITVTWGFNSEAALKLHSPDYLVNQPKQISDILSKISSN